MALPLPLHPHGRIRFSSSLLSSRRGGPEAPSTRRTQKPSAFDRLRQPPRQSSSLAVHKFVTRAGRAPRRGVARVGLDGGKWTAKCAIGRRSKGKIDFKDGHRHGFGSVLGRRYQDARKPLVSFPTFWCFDRLGFGPKEPLCHRFMPWPLPKARHSPRSLYRSLKVVLARPSM